MRLRELIDVLTKFESICGADVETSVSIAELCQKTALSFQNEYGYSRRTEQVRKPTYWVSFDTTKLYDMSEMRDTGLDGLAVGKKEENP